MGSWEGTCGISQLPIGCGEDIRVLVIRPPDGFQECEPQATNISGMCGSTDMYYPITAFIKGKYADYGMIEDIEDDGLNYLHNQVVTERLITDLSDGDDKFYGKIDPEASLEQKLEWMERERYFVRAFNRVGADCKIPLGIWMVREDVLQGLISGRRGFQARVNILTSKIQEAMVEDERLRPGGLGEQLGIDRDRLWRRWEWDIGYPLKDLLDISALRGYCDSAYGKQFIKLVREGEDEKALAVGEALATMGALHDRMRSLRKTFAPQGGKGAQHRDWSGSLQLCQVITEICLNKIREEKEYGARWAE